MSELSNTPNLRNFKEFRKALLAALGVNRSLVEVDDEEFKGGLLEGLGITYEDQDLKNFEKYRAKLIEGVDNYSGGGGGGSSDFSTAEVTISKGAMGEQVDGIIPWFLEENNETYSTIELIDEETLTVKVPMGGNSISVSFSRSAQSTNGNIESTGDVAFMSKILKSYVITGDCTITFS